MADNSSSSAGGGISFFGLLGIVFITLKLTGVINWSWWLVLLPLYGSFVLVATVFLMIFVFSILRDEIRRIIRNRKERRQFTTYLTNFESRARLLMNGGDGKVSQAAIASCN